MNEKVKVITREGTVISLEAWQKLYNLPVGGSRIGEFFYLTEARFKKDLELYGELIVNELLIRFLDALRKASNNPVDLNSFNRSQEHQEELTKEGFRTATFSPHVVRKTGSVISGACAADIDTTSDEESFALVKRIKEVSSIVKIKVRIGYKQYMQAKQTFVHVDVCPEYYAPYKPWHSLPHPRVWEMEITW
jgi:hypothetical protein